MRRVFSTPLVVHHQAARFYQFKKLAQGLKSSPPFFSALMKGILSELPEEIRKHIECIMDDVVVYTNDIDMHMKVIKAFMYKLKEYGLLLTINKVHTFRKAVKYMGLRLSSSNGRPTITPLGSRIKPIATLPIPVTQRGIKSFIGCILYLAQFLPQIEKNNTLPQYFYIFCFYVFTLKIVTKTFLIENILLKLQTP